MPEVAEATTSLPSAPILSPNNLDIYGKRLNTSAMRECGQMDLLLTYASTLPQLYQLRLNPSHILKRGIQLLDDYTELEEDQPDFGRSQTKLKHVNLGVGGFKGNDSSVLQTGFITIGSSQNEVGLLIISKSGIQVRL